MLSIQCLLLWLDDLKNTNKQTNLFISWTRNSSCSSISLRCIEECVNDNEKTAAHGEESSVQQVRYLQSWSTYQPMLTSEWIKEKFVIPLYWFMQLKWPCVWSGSSRETEWDMYRNSLLQDIEPGDKLQKYILAWLFFWGILHAHDNAKFWEPCILLFLVILQCCRREG